jgi:hypothetical protein
LGKTLIVTAGSGWVQRWGGARETIGPGDVFCIEADEKHWYRHMIELCPVGRAATPDEVGTVGALLMGPDGAFITGSDFLMDGGVTAAYWFGDLAPK